VTEDDPLGTSQYLSEPNASEVGLKITGNLTVAGWVKFATLPASNNYYGLLTNYYNNGGYGFYFSNNSGTYDFQSQFYGNVNQGAYQRVAWTPSAGVWYFVALTYNTSGSNNVKFYVRGRCESFAFVSTIEIEQRRRWKYRGRASEVSDPGGRC